MHVRRNLFKLSDLGLRQKRHAEMVDRDELRIDVLGGRQRLNREQLPQALVVAEVVAADRRDDRPMGRVLTRLLEQIEQGLLRAIPACSVERVDKEDAVLGRPIRQDLDDVPAEVQLGAERTEGAGFKAVGS